MSIKSIIKKNRILSGIAYIVRENGYTIRMRRYKSVPIQNDKVFFYRSGGGYGDNPRAIAEYMHTFFRISI